MTGRCHSKLCHCCPAIVVSLLFVSSQMILLSHPDHGQFQRICQPPSSRAHDVVHVPDFKDPALSLALSSGDFISCKNMFLNSDCWTTPDLRCHAESMFPAPGAIGNDTGVRDKAAFQQVCSVLFKEGHIFASPKQLNRAATLFLDKWGVKCVFNMGRRLFASFTNPRQRRNQTRHFTLNAEREDANVKSSHRKSSSSNLYSRSNLV
jgi:hypothetical protein